MIHLQYILNVINNLNMWRIKKLKDSINDTTNNNF